jgi:hypothetical protein
MESNWHHYLHKEGQGHRVKFLGEGIRHALRCPCYDTLQVVEEQLPF